MADNWPTKGSIEAIEGDPIKVVFAYNPKEYSISKSNTWNAPQSNRGTDSSALEFGGGQPMELKLQLFFDTYEAGTDVRKQYTDKLFKLMEINSGLPAGSSNRTGQPPKCKLQWGKVFSFVCYVTSVSCQYTLFLADGTPVRATTDVQLKQAVDPKQQPGTNPTSGGEGGERTRLVRPGDRLDLIAYREFGDAGRWRVIARANNLADPLKLRPGQVLVIPPTPHEE
jgi:hypothetical protein